MTDEIKVKGDLATFPRFPLGLWGLDHALGFRGELGMTGRSMVEIYGPEGSGKSTLGYYMAAKVRSNGKIWLADLEGTADLNYLTQVLINAGWLGEIEAAEYVKEIKGKKTMRPHEEQMQDAVDGLLENETQAGIVDSIGAFYSVVDTSKDIGEINVGRNAYHVSNLCRRASCWLRIVDDPKLLVLINHVRPNIGGPGFDTPGGVKKKYLSNVRLWIRREESDVPDGTGNFISKVTVQKLKAGGTHGDRHALVYFIPGFGVSAELSDVFDCIQLGIARREATIQLEIMDGDDKEFKWTSMGRLSTLAEKALDPKKNKATFRPFREALERYEKNI